jgi:hypothetical protein
VYCFSFCHLQFQLLAQAISHQSRRRVSPTSTYSRSRLIFIQIEGLNFRHGDIEDMLKTVAFIKGHKWTTMMVFISLCPFEKENLLSREKVKRVYFGNWLRDYSQAVDVGSLKGIVAVPLERCLKRACHLPLSLILFGGGDRALTLLIGVNAPTIRILVGTLCPVLCSVLNSARSGF